ncbi:MAG TPA: hypothetical protein VJM33_06515 [Microthrixaceae bacterium]|nr:hypothetical protein [Microthrixaceae bacterium]
MSGINTKIDDVRSDIAGMPSERLEAEILTLAERLSAGTDGTPLTDHTVTACSPTRTSAC